MHRSLFTILVLSLSVLLFGTTPSNAQRKSKGNARAKPAARTAQVSDLRQNAIKVPEGEPGAERIDFKTALKRALEKSPDYRQSQLNRGISIINAKKQWYSLLPQLDLKANHYLNRSGLPDGYGYDGQRLQPWNNSLELNLREELSDSFEGFRQARAQDLYAEQARLQFENQSNRTLTEVANLYFDYSQEAGAYQLSQSQYETYLKQFKQIETRYFQGLSSSRDYLRSKADKQRSEISVINQKYQLIQAREKLKQAIGDSSNLEFIPFDVRTLSPEVLQTNRIDVDSTLDVRSAKVAIDIAEIKVRSSEFAYWPRLGLSTSAGVFQPNYLSERRAENGDLYWNFNTTVVIDYNIWDWGIRRRDIEASKAGVQVETAARDRVRLQVNQALNSLYTNQKALQETFRISSQTLDDSEDVYMSFDRGYREGKVNYVELNTALGELYGSRQADLQLRFNILKARAELAYYEGRSDEILNSL